MRKQKKPAVSTKEKIFLSNVRWKRPDGEPRRASTRAACVARCGRWRGARRCCRSCWWPAWLCSTFFPACWPCSVTPLPFSSCRARLSTSTCVPSSSAWRVWSPTCWPRVWWTAAAGVRCWSSPVCCPPPAWPHSAASSGPSSADRSPPAACSAGCPWPRSSSTWPPRASVSDRSPGYW